MKRHKLLKNPSACRTCAMCCRVFTFYDHNAEGFVDRVGLLKTKKIKIEKTQLKTRQGRALYRIVLDIPCSALIRKKGKYYCKLYGTKKRPQMCDEYPYNVTDWERKYCKGLKRG